MWRNLRHSRELLRQFNKERKQYFEDAKEENARLNLRLLKKISIFLIPFLGFLFYLTPYVITGWHISWPYVIFVPVALLFAIYSIWYAKRPQINANIANISCVVFIIVIEALVLMIDVYIGPEYPASFMPLIFIIVPGMFVFQFSILIPLLAISEIVYVISLLYYKVPRMAQSDIFTSIVGLIFGYLMAFTIVQLRIKDNNAKREYMKRSMVDPVTGILNKFSFENSVREALKARETDKLSALLVLDIDNLKRMNDELGVMVGDMFLEDVAEYLTHIFRGSDIIGRVGGDEFMIYIRQMEDEEWLSKKCFRLQQEVKTLSNEHGNVNMTVSIGVAVIRAGKMNFDALYQCADDSLYTAKTRGRGKYIMNYATSREGEKV